MRYHGIQIKLFEFSADTDGEAHIDILEIETAEWSGSLLFLGRDMDGDWQFDLLYMRKAMFALRDWWEDRA